MGVSLCTGTGALDLALERHTGEAVEVFAETDRLAARVVGRHWPDARNMGDIAKIEWGDVEHATDWLVAGYPCQPFSLAGRRAGQADPRHLWPHIVSAVRALRPRRILLENVAGHRSQGFGDVLGDLAALGYDTRWCSVRACDVGAPHRRERVFVVAHPPHDRWDGRSGSPRRRSPRPAHHHLGPAADTAGPAGQQGRSPGPGQTSQGQQEAPQRDAGRRGGEGSAAHAQRQRRAGRTPDPGREQVGRTAAAGGGGAAAHTEREQLRLESLAQFGSEHEAQPGTADDWGRYQQAIRRWEKVLGRPAPPATRRGARGAQRLSPDFVEWMMGLPERWVTGVKASPKEHLRLLGNGVVPQQAQVALDLLAIRRTQ